MRIQWWYARLRIRLWRELAQTNTVAVLPQQNCHASFSTRSVAERPVVEGSFLLSRCNVGLVAAVSVAVVVLLAGCVSRPSLITPQESVTSSFVLTQPGEVIAPSSQALTPSEQRGMTDEEQLTLLWQKRKQTFNKADYPIGPGDLLDVNVATVEELTNRTIRVSGDGTIMLPFVGEMQAAGLTEKELMTAVHTRLEKYMYNPQINLFIKEYRSRQVAVVGAVEKPGLYNLASSADTILDVLSLAGGMKADAAPRITLIPAEPLEASNPSGTPSPLPSLLTTSTLPLVLKNGDPIIIDLETLTKGGNQMYLSLPARPGDVIMVSGSGEVLVAGWVEKPASYKITQGLTVLGAVNAAGGPHFAADKNTVKVIRTSKDGNKEFFLADLEKIKHGESKDIPVQSGDVIEVSSSSGKLVSYGFYHFLTTLFRAGLYF